MEGGLGFKDLTKFNDAMLAKQVWRLSHDTSSLFYRVFKAKYFPNSTIFDAKEKYGSYAWKNILRARKVVGKGAKWRVGDGQSIKVFEDNWLPGQLGGKIIPIQSNLNRNLKVADLMTVDKASWNEPLLDSFFLPHEAQQIKAIPLCVVPQSDYFYWSLEKSGIYSVKSGYKMLCEEARLEGSHRSGMIDLWSRIWKLKLLGKIIHFLWRACSDCLPTKVNLMKRKIVADPQCELCGSLPEDTKHALWGCEAVRRVWCVEFRWVDGDCLWIFFRPCRAVFNKTRCGRGVWNHGLVH